MKSRIRDASKEWYPPIFLVLALYAYESLTNLRFLFGISQDSFYFSYAIRLFVLAGAVFYIGRLCTVRVSGSAAWYAFAFLCFWVWYCARVAIDALFNPSALRATPLEYISLAVFVTALPAAACFFLCLHKDIKNFERYFFGFMLLGSVSASWAFFTQPVEIDLKSEQMQLTKLNSTSVSTLGLMLIVSALFSILNEKKLGFFKRISIFIIGVSIGGVLLGFGASRFGLVALGVSIFLLSLAFREKFRGLRLIYPSLLIIFFVAIFVYTSKKEVFSVLMSRTEGGNLFIDDGRSEMVVNALKVFLSTPVLGAGIEPLGWYPHNLLIESFLANGILFGLLTCYLILTSLIYSFRLIVDQSDIAFLPIVYILLCIQSFVSGGIYMSNAFWVAQAAVTGLYFRYKKVRRRSNNRNTK